MNTNEVRAAQEALFDWYWPDELDPALYRVWVETPEARPFLERQHAATVGPIPDSERLVLGNGPEQGLGAELEKAWARFARTHGSG